MCIVIDIIRAWSFVQTSTAIKSKINWSMISRSILVAWTESWPTKWNRLYNAMHYAIKMKFLANTHISFPITHYQELRTSFKCLALISEKLRTGLYADIYCIIPVILSTFFPLPLNVDKVTLKISHRKKK